MGIDADFLKFLQEQVPKAFSAEYPVPEGPTDRALDLSQIVYKRLPHDSFLSWQTIRGDIIRELEGQLVSGQTRFVAVCCDVQELVPFAKNCERKDKRSRVAYSLEELSSPPLNIVERSTGGTSTFSLSDRFVRDGIWGDADRLMATRIVRDFITDRMLFFAKDFLEGYFAPSTEDTDRWRALALIGIPAEQFIQSSDKEMLEARRSWASRAFSDCAELKPVDLRLNPLPRCSAVSVQRRCKQDGAVQRSGWRIVDSAEYGLAGEFDLQWLDFIRVARCLDRHPKLRANLNHRRTICLHSSDGDAIETALLHFSRPGAMAEAGSYDVVLDRTIHPSIGKNKTLVTRFINLSELHRGLTLIHPRLPLTLAAAIAMREMDYTECLQNVGKETMLLPTGDFDVVKSQAEPATAKPAKRMPVSRPYMSVHELTKNGSKLLSEAIRWLPDGSDVQVYTGQLESTYVALMEQKIAPFLGMEPIPVTRAPKKLTEWRAGLKERMQAAKGYDRAKKRGDKPIRLYLPSEDGLELERALARITWSVRYYAGVLQMSKSRMVGFGTEPAAAWHLVPAPEPVNPLDMAVTVLRNDPNGEPAWQTVE